MNKINTRPSPEFGPGKQWSAYAYQNRVFTTAYAATEVAAIKKLGEMFAEKAEPFTTEQIEFAIAMRELGAVCDHNDKTCREWYGNALSFIGRRKQLRDVKIQIAAGLIVSIALGISIGLYIASNIVGRVQ